MNSSLSVPRIVRIIETEIKNREISSLSKPMRWQRTNHGYRIFSLLANSEALAPFSDTLNIRWPSNAAAVSVTINLCCALPSSHWPRPAPETKSGNRSKYGNGLWPLLLLRAECPAKVRAEVAACLPELGLRTHAAPDSQLPS